VPEDERSADMDRVSLTKVRVDLSGIVDDGWPPSTAEWLWAEDLGGGLFRIDNVPIFARGISSNDVVRAHKVDDRWEFDEVARDGGHGTFRIMLQRGDSLAGEPAAELWAILSDLGAAYEGYQGGPLFAIDVPPSEVVAARAVLERGEQLGVWEYEDGNVRSSS
jgi:hypothetical protein